MTIEELKSKVNGWFQPKNEAERAKLKKYAIVFPAMFLTFIVVMWLIFGNGFSSGKTDTSNANMELPDGDNTEIEGNKLKAMQTKALEEQKNRNDSVVQTFTEMADTMPINMSNEPTAIESSAQAYQEVQASLEDFYIPENQADAQVAELQSKIDELEAQATVAQQQSQPNEMELMERSYQLASQYFGNGNQQAVVVDEPKENRKIMPVNQVNRNVVSSLSEATSERSFSTAVGGKRQGFRNTIAACVASDQSVMDGQSVKLRTLEPMWVGNSLLPKNTPIIGRARLQGERLEITIENIEAMGCIMEVDLAVYDSDGQEGINIPNSLESDALKEIGANMGSTVGSSINISTNVGAQLASDVGKGLLNGVSQYLTKKVREVKVHLKAGYKVMLHQPEDN